MNPISKTAFYCCGVRMLDAESPTSVIGDEYAKVFMNEEGLQILDAFKDEASPNASNIARHRIIDDFLRRELLADPKLNVVLIGAGFDSRAFRLTGGKWFELDEPQVIEYKNERLPAAESENNLRRVPINFATESLAEKLSALSIEGRVVVVVEGVFGYLEETQISELLETLRRIFPTHKLICDLTSKKFIEKYSRKMREKLGGIGAVFKFFADDPEKIFLENGYRRTEKISVVASAVDYELIKIPKFLLKTFLRTLADGYTIFIFESS